MMSLFEILESLYSAGMREEYKALRGYIDERDDLIDRIAQYERDPEIVDAENGHGLPFTVMAGKYDGGERNIKYVDSFVLFDEAVAALKYVSDYPWYELEWHGHVLTLA